MKHTVIVLCAGLLVVLAVTLTVVTRSGFGPPPQALRGDWEIPPQPGAMPGSMLPAMRIRITSSEFYERFAEGDGVLAVLDETAGKESTVVTDSDGSKWVEAPHLKISVSTKTMPWMFNLETKAKTGKRVVERGICMLRGASLKLAIARPGEKRPVSFENAMEATRVEE